MIQLAILIPTMPERAHTRLRLIDALWLQISTLQAHDEVKILFEESKHEKQGGPTTGKKRNILKQRAHEMGAQAIAYFDDDDMPGTNYIKKNLEGVKAGFDVCELWGQIYFSGKPGNQFHHSIIHDHWYQDKKYYYRNPNHISTIRLDLIKDIWFRDQTIGEDGHFSIDLQKSGVLKNEFKIPEVTYHYFK